MVIFILNYPLRELPSADTSGEVNPAPPSGRESASKFDLTSAGESGMVSSVPERSPVATWGHRSVLRPPLSVCACEPVSGRWESSICQLLKSALLSLPHSHLSKATCNSGTVPPGGDNAP